MATFDLNRLSPELYDMKDVSCALDFQNMARGFMHVVKTNPGFFDNHEKAVKDFCALLENDDMWQLSYAVVPEFRLRQDHGPCEDTLLNTILRTMTHKRPRVPVNDPSLEKDMPRKMYRTEIEYLETLGLGYTSLDADGRAELEGITRRTLKVLED